MTAKRKQGGKGGRPSKFKQDWKTAAKVLGRLGATNKDIAEAFNVSQNAVVQWRKKVGQFQHALKAGKDEADEQVEKSLFSRANGYSHPDIEIKTVSIGAGVSKIVTVPTVKHYPPDTTACIFWLKNRKPEQWRERQEVTGADGGPLQIGFYLDTKDVTGPDPVLKKDNA